MWVFLSSLKCNAHALRLPRSWGGAWTCFAYSQVAIGSERIDLFGDILLHYKWLNTLDSLVFIWSIHPIKIEVESDENVFSIPDVLQKGIPNLVLLNLKALTKELIKQVKWILGWSGHPECNSKKVYIQCGNRKVVCLFKQETSEGARWRLWKRGRNPMTRHRNIASQPVTYIGTQPQ